MKSKFWKIVLPAVIVAVLGFVFLNAIFVIDWGWTSLLKFIFWPKVELTDNWIPQVMQGSFLIIVAGLSWLVYRTKINIVFKAAFTMVPVAVILVLDGVLLYRTPVLAYIIGTVITVGILTVFYFKKLPWLYWFAVIIVALSLVIMGLTGTDI